jgi:hypothetical protein
VKPAEAGDSVAAGRAGGRHRKGIALRSESVKGLVRERGFFPGLCPRFGYHIERLSVAK